MATGWIEQGIEQGIQRGVEKGQREILRKQLERRFGPLSTPVQERLRQLPAERLEEVALALLQAQSLRELGLED